MEISKVKRLARRLMNKYNLQDWKFEINDSKKWLGFCKPKIKEISLSKYHVRYNTDDEIRDTILHEIAHALVGTGNHDSVWKDMARKLGATPRASANLEYVPTDFQIWWDDKKNKP